MQETNAMLAAAMLANRKKTTKTSDSKKEVAIRLKEIIHSISFASHRQLRDFAMRAPKMANATAIAGKSAEILVDFDLGIRYC